MQNKKFVLLATTVCHLNKKIASIFSPVLHSNIGCPRDLFLQSNNKKKNITASHRLKIIGFENIKKLKKPIDSISTINIYLPVCDLP